jgi:hypothetical protein
MLVLPSGQVLMSDSGTRLALYTPDGAPDPAWKPTISGITPNGDGTFLLIGTQLNGLNAGASYGDDAEMDSNYPLVQLVDAGGNVSYARTFGWSSTGVATGATPVSTYFTPPAGVVPGDYSLSVIANGIASDPVTFTVGGPAPAAARPGHPAAHAAGSHAPATPARSAAATVPGLAAASLPGTDRGVVPAPAASPGSGPVAAAAGDDAGGGRAAVALQVRMAVSGYSGPPAGSAGARGAAAAAAARDSGPPAVGARGAWFASAGLAARDALPGA